MVVSHLGRSFHARLTITAIGRACRRPRFHQSRHTHPVVTITHSSAADRRLILVCRQWSNVDELDSHVRDVTCIEGFGLAHGTLDGQHVAATCAVREDRGRPGAAADRDPYPHRTKAAIPTARQVTNLLGCLGREANEGPAVGAPSVPYPQLGIEYDDHEFSITHGPTVVDRSYVPRRLEAERQALRLTQYEWMIPLFGESERDGKRDVLEGRFVWLATRECCAVGST
jgi:hypothetical protein